MQKLFFCCFFIILFSHYQSFSQQKEIIDNEELWLGYITQFRFSQKWGAMADMHYRTWGHFIDNPRTSLQRAGISYYLTDNLRLTAGYALFQHYPFANTQIMRTEHRPWQQLWYKQEHGKLQTVQVFRIEQRYNQLIINNQATNDYNFNYRFRFMYVFNIPLKGTSANAPKVPVLVLADEVMVNIGNDVIYNHFDQNRIIVGLSYLFNRTWQLQVSYMNIYQQRAIGDIFDNTHSIRAFMFCNLDFRKK